MVEKEDAIKKVKEIEMYIRKEPVKSVAIAVGVGAGIGFLIGCLACRR